MYRWIAIAFFFLVTACHHDANDQCRASFRQTTKFTIGGVDIPIGAMGSVKIGSATYTQEQAKELESLAQEMEQVRLTQCIALNPKVLELLPPTDRAAVVSRGQTAFALLTRWAEKLKVSTNATAVLAEGSAVIGEVKSSVQPTPSVPGTGASGDAMPTAQLALSTATAASASANEARSAVKALSERVAAVADRAAPVRIVVTGFEASAVSLTQDQKASLRVNFSEALQEAPQNRMVVVQVLGYADASGRRDRNIVLGLLRAQAVAEFLQRQQFERPYSLVVGSAGVALPPNSERRVEVVIA